jgi:hypothetical protein
MDMMKLRRSLAGNLLSMRKIRSVGLEDIQFLMDETRLDQSEVIGVLDGSGIIHP